MPPLGRTNIVLVRPDYVVPTTLSKLGLRIYLAFSLSLISSPTFVMMVALPAVDVITSGQTGLLSPRQAGPQTVRSFLLKYAHLGFPVAATEKQTQRHRVFKAAVKSSSLHLNFPFHKRQNDFLSVTHPVLSLPMTLWLG